MIKLGLFYIFLFFDKNENWIKIGRVRFIRVVYFLVRLGFVVVCKLGLL